MPTLTIFRQEAQIASYKPLITILRQIRKGMFKRIVEDLRWKKLMGKEEKAALILNTIPHFSPAGKYIKEKNALELKIYAQLILLDIEVHGAKHQKIVKELAAKLPFTLACFLRADGEGVAVLVKVNTEKDCHCLAFDQVARYYALRLATKIGSTGQQLVDLYPYSYDPEIYINPESSFYPVKPNPVDIPPLEIAIQQSTSEKEELKMVSTILHPIWWVVFFEALYHSKTLSLETA